MTGDDDPARGAEDYLIRYGGDRYPEIVVAAQGSIVRDRSGREVLDFTSGQMCATVGHSHPAVVAAIKDSAERAIHLFSGMIPDAVVKLARKIGQMVPRPAGTCGSRG
jgi:2,2-dialkylglycine decarboxylase (pyruvate)